MKKGMVVLAVLMAAFVLVSCTSTAADIEGTGVTLNTNKAEIIDYKGQAFGSNIPGWVLDASASNTKAVQKALGLDGQKVWILQNDGQDLDMLKLWTDQVDARTQITTEIEQTIGDKIKASMSGTEEDKEKALTELSTRTTNLTMNGLDKVTDYWTRTRTLKVGVKKAKSEKDYDYKYTYLVVFAMDEALYEEQVRKALLDVDDNDDQSPILREMVTEELTNADVALFKAN